MQFKLQELKMIDSPLLDRSFLIRINGANHYVDSQGQINQGTPDYFIGWAYVYYNSQLSNYNKNFLHIHNMGSLFSLENIVLSDADVEHCNKHGLEIFLTEQIIFLCCDTLPKIDFVSCEYTEEIKKSFIPNFQDCKYSVKSLELDSCKEFIKNNKLNNVTICIGNTDPENLLDHYNLKIVRKDPFLQAISKINKTKKNQPPNKINTKFWCGNWRYEPHRHIIAAYLTTVDSKLSWYFDGGVEAIDHFYWFKLESWKTLYPTYYDKLITGIENLNKNHYYIDLKNNKRTLTNTTPDLTLRADKEGDHPSFESQTHQRLYQDTFCSIINSSSFAVPFPTYDEKVLNAIINYRPFILVGPPGSLSLMKNDGFKTFSEFWDESYDNETDHQKRFIKIFEIIDYIESLSIQECRDMYVRMDKILKYNYNVSINLNGMFV